MSTEITSEFVWHNIPPRPRDSHKGSFGTVLAVAGSAYYRGAALLAAEGALRTGAGIVTLASVEPVLAAAVARLPECCLCPCVVGAEGGISPESIPQLQRQKATVLLLGPGLGGTAQSTGRAAETRTLVQKLLPGFAGSAVLDADGLNAAAQLLAEGKTLPHPAGELIVTPHPGEMARLTGLRWRRSMRTVKILPASMQKNGTLWWYSRAAVPWWLHRMAACAQTLPETQALPGAAAEMYWPV